MKYTVELELTYNGTMTVNADSEEDAVEIANKRLNADTLKPFPDEVKIPNGKFTFESAVACYAYEEEEENEKHLAETTDELDFILGNKED